jgi:hypothetical protein
MKPVSDPFRNSDANIAKYAGTSEAPRTRTRILVRDAKVRCRFFDGYDWPKAKKRQYVQGGDFVIEPVSQEKLDSEKADLNEKMAVGVSDSQTSKLETKAKLLGDLLEDNAETDETTFGSTPLPEERGAMLKDLADQRRLSRRMNKFLQVSLSGLKMRLDAFSESDEHRLASCIDVAITDFFVAETISTAKPVKLLGEWFNETEHPRDSNDGLIMMKVSPLSYDTHVNRMFTLSHCFALFRWSRGIQSIALPKTMTLQTTRAKSRWNCFLSDATLINEQCVLVLRSLPQKTVSMSNLLMLGQMA